MYFGWVNFWSFGERFEVEKGVRCLRWGIVSVYGNIYFGCSGGRGYRDFVIIIIEVKLLIYSEI